MKNCVDTIDGHKPIVITGDEPAQRLNRKRRDWDASRDKENDENEGFADLKESLTASKHEKARADLFSQSLKEYSHLIHTEIVSKQHLLSN